MAVAGPETSPAQGKSGTLGCSGDRPAPAHHAPAGAGVPGVWELEGAPTAPLHAGAGCCLVRQVGRTGYPVTEKLPFCSQREGSAGVSLSPLCPGAEKCPFQTVGKMKEAIVKPLEISRHGELGR